jgi:hypothetical protein
MSLRARRLSWFGGLYLAAIATLLLITLLLHGLLHLLT